MCWRLALPNPQFLHRLDDEMGKVILGLHGQGVGPVGVDKKDLVVV